MEKRNTSVAISSQGFSMDLDGFWYILLIRVGVMNHILILSRPFIMQGRNLLL